MEESLQRVYQIVDTTATKKIFELKKRIRAVAGGTSASKTISILIWLIDYCQSSKNINKLATVVSESAPHLAGGAITDFEVIMKDRGYWDDKCWVRSPYPTYTFGRNNRLEFKSVDTYSKAHGPRRDVLFINECNNLPYIIADQLIIRTRETIWLDWNPTSEFWFYQEMLGKRDDIDFITLTYLDNEALDEGTKKEIESHRHLKNWWKVYGEGLLGEAEGRIYIGWNQMDEIPSEARLKRKGLDFGYSNDLTALLDVYVWNNAFIWDELLYRKGMSNKDIASVIKQGEDALVVADSAEPKSIDEIASYGVSILPSQKGPGSVLQGIQYVQDQTIYVTKRSLNIWKEYRNYLWLTDKDGKIINEPQDFMDHLLTAGRYAMESLKPTSELPKPISLKKWSLV